MISLVPSVLEHFINLFYLNARVRLHSEEIVGRQTEHGSHRLLVGVTEDWLVRFPGIMQRHASRLIEEYSPGTIFDFLGGNNTIPRAFSPCRDAPAHPGRRRPCPAARRRGRCGHNSGKTADGQVTAAPCPETFSAQDLRSGPRCGGSAARRPRMGRKAHMVGT